FEGVVGAAFPAVIQHGVAATAANIDEAWLGADVAAILSAAVGAPVRVLNDADAAGLAELRVGAGRGVAGTVVMVTFGTGIGTGVFVDGVLVPNTELGHIEVDGHDAESRAANSARKREELSWEQWAKRLSSYYQALERLFSPDLFVVGGGVSKHGGEFIPLIDISTEIVSATLRNTAGIVGAAALAADRDT
ncbi:MAG: ROK family protein, partial [Marmoricola sp.]|nr:ROK family protein [Marmoricola sp.]